MERLVGDMAFRSALSENVDNPRTVTERYGIEVDPMEMLPLWRGSYLNYRFKPECASWPLAVMWDEYMREMLRHRDILRDEGEMSTVNPRFHAWRERQIRRCDGELGGSAPSVTHPVIAFELSEGCTVGCWFCGLSADRFEGYYEYSEEHAELWRGVVGVASEMFGSAARTGFCYWATDPIDNPDYDRFLFDYYQITGALPQTTTAAPLKDQALTRRVLELFKRYRGVTNRFSVLSTNHLNQIHEAFSPEDLMGVELVLQGKEALTAKAFRRARARERRNSAQQTTTMQSRCWSAITRRSPAFPASS
nr:radical SAM family RiPP maturation amino acid epimerase [Mesorhizobium huakuii]